MIRDINWEISAAKVQGEGGGRSAPGNKTQKLGVGRKTVKNLPEKAKVSTSAAMVEIGFVCGGVAGESWCFLGWWALGV